MNKQKGTPVKPPTTSSSPTSILPHIIIIGVIVMIFLLEVLSSSNKQTNSTSNPIDTTNTINTNKKLQNKLLNGNKKQKTQEKKQGNNQTQQNNQASAQNNNNNQPQTKKQDAPSKTETQNQQNNQPQQQNNQAPPKNPAPPKNAEPPKTEAPKNPAPPKTETQNEQNNQPQQQNNQAPPKNPAPPKTETQNQQNNQPQQQNNQAQQNQETTQDQYPEQDTIEVHDENPNEEEDDNTESILPKKPIEYEDGSLSEMPYDIIGDCPILNWQQDKPFADEMVRAGLPVILRNTSLAVWDAMSKWRVDYFRERMVKIRARRMTRSFINYEDVSPLEEVFPQNSGVWPNAEESNSMLILDKDVFFDELSNTTDKTIISTSFQIPVKLLSDVSPRTYMKLNDKDYVYFAVWIGEKGSTTAAHSDPDENFYAQIYGEKLFVLFSPENHRNFFLYPRASPNHKQVQVWGDMKSNNAYKRRMDRPKPQGINCLLKPGDLLYLPAYWFHHVVAQETPAERSDTGKPIPYSISINFWSVAFYDACTLSQIAGPFDEDFKGNNRYIWNAFPTRFTERDVYERTKVFTTLFVLMKLYGDNYIDELFDLYNTRFLPIFGPANYTDDSICGKKVTLEEYRVIENNFKPWVDHHVKALQTAPEGPIRQFEVWNWVELQLTYPSRNINLANYITNCLLLSNLIHADAGSLEAELQQQENEPVEDFQQGDENYNENDQGADGDNYDGQEQGQYDNDNIENENNNFENDNQNQNDFENVQQQVPQQQVPQQQVPQQQVPQQQQQVPADRSPLRRPVDSSPLKDRSPLRKPQKDEL